MSLIPYEPFRQMDLLRREVDRLFTESLPNALASGTVNPRVDVYETETEVVVSCEIPGLERKEDVQIDVEESTLKISGHVSRSHEIKEEQMFKTERYVGRFQRSVSLPKRVKSEGATATYKNGILEIRLPKLQGENKKSIDVNFH